MGNLSTVMSEVKIKVYSANIIIEILLLLLLLRYVIQLNRDTQIFHVRLKNIDLHDFQIFIN